MAEILVIDDNSEIRLLIANILGGAGHQMREAGDGAAGLALCRASRPELIITDIVMPEKEGLEVIRELSREMPGLPVLAISGAENPTVYLRAAGLFGAAACLSKPFRPDELLRAVRAALSSNPDADDARESADRRVTPIYSGYGSADCPGEATDIPVS